MSKKLRSLEDLSLVKSRWEKREKDFYEDALAQLQLGVSPCEILHSRSSSENFVALGLAYMQPLLTAGDLDAQSYKIIEKQLRTIFTTYKSFSQDQLYGTGMGKYAIKNQNELLLDSKDPFQLLSDGLVVTVELQDVDVASYALSRIPVNYMIKAKK